MMSFITDPVGEVIIPIFFGIKGKDIFLLISKKPDFSSLFFLSSINFNKAPSPAISIFSILI